MDKKPTNPKDALGIRKVAMHCVPTKPMLELGLAMMEGGRKYGTHNYRAIGVRSSTYYNAALRHITAWWEGEDIDPDSGLSHIVKAMSSLLVLRDSMHMGNLEDDRPPQYPKGMQMNELNKQAGDIIDKYPDCTEPYTQTKKHDESSISRYYTVQETGFQVGDRVKVSMKNPTPADHGLNGRLGTVIDRNRYGCNIRLDYRADLRDKFSVKKTIWFLFDELKGI